MALVKSQRVQPLDDLSDWTMPPASDAQPVRVFDSAEDAMRFLIQLRRATSEQARIRSRAR